VLEGWFRTVLLLAVQAAVGFVDAAEFAVELVIRSNKNFKAYPIFSIKCPQHLFQP